MPLPNIVGSREEKVAQIFTLTTRLRERGIPTFPLKLDGTKEPNADYLPCIETNGREKKSWKPFQDRLPTEDELEWWFVTNHCNGYGIPQGQGREVLDFDCKSNEEKRKLLQSFLEKIKAELPGFLDKCPLIGTPGQGVHIYYRTETNEGNQPLAKVMEPVPDKPGIEKAVTLIETRGAGGYVVGPNNPPTVHPSGKLYAPLNDVAVEDAPLISNEERQKLFQIARSFNECPEAPKIDKPESTYEGEDRPGDLFKQQAEWDEILTPHGWQFLFSDGAGIGYWKRPDKHDDGHSACTYPPSGDCPQDLLIVYSSNAEPFEQWSESNRVSYTKFHAYTLLEFGGDTLEHFSQAGKELHKLGYVPDDPLAMPSNADQEFHNRYGDDGIYRGTYPLPEGPHEAPQSHEAKETNHNANKPTDQARGKYAFAPLTSAELARSQWPIEWIVNGILVRGQPAVLGGPKKVLKTNILCDLNISMGSGLSTLGTFRTKKIKSVLISGESGGATIKETAFRICQAKGVALSDCQCGWDFRLPKLSAKDELQELTKGLKDQGIEVVIIDPLYLCLLSGGKSEKQASNLFDMGPLLLDVGFACLEAGATPILTHHAKKFSGSHDYSPLDLEDLAFAGIQEFARQWVLINRREKYIPGKGLHKLWLSTGGSVGHGNLWGIDINEGQLQDDFTGRIWDVSVKSMADIQANKVESKQAEEMGKQDKREMELLSALKKCKLAPSKNKLQQRMGWRMNILEDAIARLEERGLVRVEQGKFPASDGRLREGEYVFNNY